MAGTARPEDRPWALDPEGDPLLPIQIANEND